MLSHFNAQRFVLSSRQSCARSVYIKEIRDDKARRLDNVAQTALDSESSLVWLTTSELSVVDLVWTECYWYILALLISDI